LLFLYFAFTSTFIYKLYTLEGAHFRCVLCPDAGEWLELISSCASSSVCWGKERARRCACLHQFQSLTAFARVWASKIGDVRIR
jgi:hypothetical protein